MPRARVFKVGSDFKAGRIIYTVTKNRKIQLKLTKKKIHM